MEAIQNSVDELSEKCEICSGILKAQYVLLKEL